MQPGSRRRLRGLTLLEMMAVVAVLGLLVLLVMPALNAIAERGRTVQCMNNMKQVAERILHYSAEHNNRILPALTGTTNHMNETTWYELLDESGVLPGNPNNPLNAGLSAWGESGNDIMSCPSRDEAATSFWRSGRHALHYTVNQHPGFLNRVNTTTGPWPTLAAIQRPSRTFLLAEATWFLGYPDGENLAYPHPRRGPDPAQGDGMNLIFYDGHAEFFQGRLPVLPGANFTVVPYDSIAPEESYPWF